MTEKKDFKRCGQVGYYRPAVGDPPIPVYRESTDDPWLPCLDAPIAVPIDMEPGENSIPATPGYSQFCSLMADYAYTCVHGLVKLTFHAHNKEHRALARFYDGD